MNVDECWDYLELQIKKRDPMDLSLLPSGAGEDAIASAEAIMKVRFPPAMKKFYRRHDGSGPFEFSPWIEGGGSHAFMSLESVVSTWLSMSEIGADFENESAFGEQHGPVKQNWWNRRWIPVTENGCGDNIFIDFDPDEGGSVGQIVDWCHEGAVSKFVADSLLDWLNDIVAAIEDGTMKFDSPTG